jgi:hypothetical protein
LASTTACLGSHQAPLARVEADPDLAAADRVGGVDLDRQSEHGAIPSTSIAHTASTQRSPSISTRSPRGFAENGYATTGAAAGVNVDEIVASEDAKRFGGAEVECVGGGAGCLAARRGRCREFPQDPAVEVPRCD